MKSSSTAPPAAAHAHYIARDGQYQERGGLELVESGNMPSFAREDPYAFWQAADDFERKNGRGSSYPLSSIWTMQLGTAYRQLGWPNY